MDKNSSKKQHPQTVEKNSNSQQDLIEQKKDVDSILKDLPVEKRKEIKSLILQQRTEICHHQGPIPCPDDLAEYNKIIPNGADRIMQMAEKQQHHRMELENIVVKCQQKQSLRGQTFGLILGITGLLTAAFLGFTGHETIGSIIGGSTVISLVSVFVIGRTKQNTDLKTKKESYNNKQ